MILTAQPAGVPRGLGAPARARQLPLLSRPDWRHYLLLAPALALLAALLAAPAVYIGWLSFQQSTYGQDAVFVGLANYVTIFQDYVFWRAFWNTFFTVNGIVYGELALGLAMAVLLRGWMPGRRLLIAAILAPYAVTETSGIVMWRYMLEPDVGLLTQGLAALGLPAPAWTTDPVQTLFVAGLVAIWHHLPFTFLVLYAALTTVPTEALEAADIDGASGWQKFRRIEVPLIMPAIMIAIVFRYIFAIRMFSEVWLLTQGGPARLSEVLAIYLYRETFKYHDFGVASATGLVMLAAALAIAVPYLRRMLREARQ
jgi:multiple sugar transport system permease protein